MRACSVCSISLVSLSLFACGAPTDDNWPRFEVSGIVTNAQGQPVPSLNVEVRTWPPNDCGVGTGHQLIFTTTNIEGRYGTRVTSLTSTYSACIRITAGSALRDTTVLEKPALQAVQLDVQLP